MGDRVVLVADLQSAPLDLDVVRQAAGSGRIGQSLDQGQNHKAKISSLAVLI